MDPEVVPLIIGGERVACDQALAVQSPATGDRVAVVSNAGAAEVDRALHAARQAFGSWASLPLGTRQALIRRYADLLDRDRERLIDLLVAETGKPRDNAEYDHGMLVTCLRYFVEEASRVKQEVVVDPDSRFHHYLRRQPLGVVVGYLAWNFPLLNLGYKLGPALAAGCTVVLKPSCQTPVASLAAAALALEAGLPPGVVNVLVSSDRAATERLLTSPNVAMVTMIGSTEAGVAVMQTASTSVKRFSLELGGNAPVLVYPDADLADAAAQIVGLKLTNCGQVCVSPNRCFVHERVAAEFVELARQQMAAYHLGSGTGPTPRMGPLISRAARERVLHLTSAAVREGATVVWGGEAADIAGAAGGAWLRPTLLAGCRPDMAVCREEIFGPVLPVLTFGDHDDPIALANDTSAGLAAYVFTRDLATALRAAEGIDAGSVCVNEPHYAAHLPHGGLKQSGVGKDCSPASLEEYLTLKRVSIRIT